MNKAKQKILKEFEEFIDSGTTPNTPDYPSEGYEEWNCYPSDVKTWLDGALDTYALSVLPEKRGTHFMPRFHNFCVNCGGTLSKPCEENEFDDAIRKTKDNINNEKM